MCSLVMISGCCRSLFACKNHASSNAALRAALSHSHFASSYSFPPVNVPRWRYTSISFFKCAAFGVLVAFSQCWIVLSLTPINRANDSCDILALVRNIPRRLPRSASSLLLKEFFAYISCLLFAPHLSPPSQCAEGTRSDRKAEEELKGTTATVISST